MFVSMRVWEYVFRKSYIQQRIRVLGIQELKEKWKLGTFKYIEWEIMIFRKRFDDWIVIVVNF